VLNRGSKQLADETPVFATEVGAMPNPTGQGLKLAKKGERRGGRQPGGQNLFTRELKEALLDAAQEVGEIEEIDVLDEKGKPTGITSVLRPGFETRG
jgi:hypothetical protein